MELSPTSAASPKHEEFECMSKVNIEPIPAACLLPVCGRLLQERNFKTWQERDVKELVSLLAGRICGIDGRGPENAAGMNAFLELSDEFERYIEATPGVRAILDPVYLEVDPATGAGGPGNLQPPNVPPLPPSMAPLLPQGASGCSWVFVAGAIGKQQAIHLLGVLQGANPGLQGRIYTTSVPVLMM